MKNCLRFQQIFPLHDAPTERPPLVVGTYILQNLKLSTLMSIVKHIPASRADDVASNLKLLAKINRKYSKIIIHVGSNDVQLRQSEVTKINVESVCAFAKTLLDCSFLWSPA